MSIFGWLGSGNGYESSKRPSETRPASGGGSFAPPSANMFGWGSPQPAAPPPPPVAPSQGSTPAPTGAAGPAQARAQGPAQAQGPAPVQAPTAGPGANQPDKSTEKQVDPKVVRETTNQLFKAMDGWGTDEDTLLNALRGKSPAEIQAIKAEYQDHFGRSLDSDIRKELGGKDLKEAQAALTADPVQTAVAALDNAANGGLLGMGTDEGKIQSVLEGIKDPAQRKQVMEAYQKKTGTSLDTMLKKEMSGNDLSLSRALLSGDTTKANAVRLDEAMNGGVFGFGTDEEGVYKALESCKDENERKALAAAYEKKTGQPLTAALGREFSGAEKDVADSLLAGNAAAANAARVKVAADNFWGTDEEGIFKSMEGKSKEEREKLIAQYNQMYGGQNGKPGKTFDQMLKSELGGLDLEKADQLKDSGKISDEFALKYATSGLGTNEDLLKKTLEGKSKAEIDALRKTYKDKYGQDLDALLGSECSGRDGFEISQLLKGKPETPEEMIARANEAYDFDRGSGSNWFSRGFTDLISDSGQVLDYQHKRINQIATQAGPSGQFTDEQKARLGTLTSYQQQDVQNYQAAKDTATNALANGTAIVVGAAVSIGTAGTASPAVIAALSALLGGASSMAVKGVMQEGGYALEDMGIDAVTTLASAASAGLIKLPGIDSQLNKLVGIADPAQATVLQSMMKSGASGALKGGIDSTVGGLMNEANYQGDLGDFIKGMGTQVGTGMASGFLSGSASGGVGTAMGSGPQGANPYAWAALKGGASGMAGGAAGNLVNPAAYSGRPEDIAKQWLTVVGQSGLSGALDSVVEAHGEIKKQKQLQAQVQPADEGPAQAPEQTTGQTPEQTKPQTPADQEAAGAQGKKSASSPEEAGKPDEVSDVKAKVEAEKQGTAVAASPEEEAAKIKLQAESEKATSSAQKPDPANAPTDPAEVKQPLTAQEAFDLAEKANYQPKKGQQPDPAKAKAAAEAKAELAKRLPELLAAQTDARLAPTQDGQALQTQRQAFETALAHSPEVEAAIKPTLDMMCEKAFDYLARTRGDNLAQSIGDLGVDPHAGLAGAVGTSPEVMIDVLANGNVRERAIALSSFQQLLAKDAMAPGGIERMRQIFGGEQQGSPAIQFGKAEVDALQAKVDALPEGARSDNPDWKALFPAGAKDGQHGIYATAKGQDMDTKLPALPAEVVQAQLGDTPVQQGTSLTGSGEKSALSRTTMTIEQAAAAGVKLSPREIAAAQANGGVLPWNVGTTANMVDPSAEFISSATSAALPLKAGISGTTFRFMGGAELLGADPAMARLACLAQLIGIEAHSFHEIASASQGFQKSGSSYDPSMPYTPASTGLSEADLMALMLRNGMLPSDINQPVQPPPAADHKSQYAAYSEP